jgi:hypothetical protein
MWGDSGVECRHAAETELTQERKFTAVAMKKPLHFALLLGILTAVPALASDDEDLAKKSQSPIGNLISVPFEHNFNFGVGPEDALELVLNLKPVYPVNIGKWNVVNRPDGLLGPEPETHLM